MNAEKLNWNHVTYGKTEQRVRMVQAVLNGLDPQEKTKVRLEECVDEWTGRRYGRANIRRGRAVKIGGGGRNLGSAYAYQVWLVWN